MVIWSFYWFIYLIFKLLSNLKIMKNRRHCHFNTSYLAWIQMSDIIMHLHLHFSKRYNSNKKWLEYRRFVIIFHHSVWISHQSVNRTLLRLRESHPDHRPCREGHRLWWQHSHRCRPFSHHKDQLHR
jgi:hypothetical protein